MADTPVKVFTTKRTASALKYFVDFSTWMPAGESIDTATLVCTPAGLTVGDLVVDAGASTVTAPIASGASGVTYNQKWQIVTTPSGLIKEVLTQLPVSDLAA